MLIAVLALASASRGQAQACPGDCSGDGQVGVNELITCVGIVLADGSSSTCPACDGDGDGGVAINELIAGVNSALGGCAQLDLPDLAPVSARFRSTTPACIHDTSEIRLSLEVCVANQGTVASGPFDVHVLGEPFGRVAGLAVGAQTCLQGPFVPFSIDVLVDAEGEVGETDERDNFASYFVPQPSPPPFCEATPTSTETPTLTETPTPIATTTHGPPCSDDPDCPLGDVCDEQDTCVTVTPTATPTDPGPPCGGDDDCLIGSVCTDFVCLEATPTASAPPPP